jgi:hypothetical protein
MQMPLLEHHPVEDLFGLEDEVLPDLMPLLELGRNLEENSGKDTVVRIVVNVGEPKKQKPILSKAVRFVWVAEAQFSGTERVTATLNVLDKLRNCCRGPGVCGLVVGILLRDGREQRFGL